MILEKYKFKDYKLEYFLIYILVAFSCHGYFYKFPQYIVIGTFISVYIFYRKRLNFDVKAIFWILFVMFLEFLQMLVNFKLNIPSLLSIFFRLVFAYTIIQILGKNFIPLFIRFIYFFSIISLIIFPILYFNQSLHLFIIYNILPKIPNLFTYEHPFYTYSAQLLIYSFHDYYRYGDIFRNPSLFWEPGVFAAFLCITIVLNIYYNKNQGILNKYNIIFFISLITTFSTMGYIVLAFIIVYLLLLNKGFFLKLSILPLFVFIFFIAFEELPFLKQKLTKDYELAGSLETTAGRFGSAYFDFIDFMNSPIIGTGRDESSRFKFSATYDYTSKHRNNGLTGLLATYGLIGFIVYFILLFYGEKNIGRFYNTNLKGLFTITVAFVGFGSPILQLAFFWGLTFLFIAYQRNNNISYDKK